MCGGPKWKREVVQDHKFDFMSVADFRDNGFKMRTKYLFLFLVFFKSFAVYMSDIFTAVTMLTTTSWSNQIFDACTAQTSGCVFIPFNTGKWLFVGCIIFSFLLLGYEARKAKLIVASHDISYAFTNVIIPPIGSYDHFCFFDHISNSTKTSDDFAFFVFFVFKSWKRVLLADGPRQTINALTLYAVWLAKHGEAKWDISKYFAGNQVSTSLLTVTTLFTVIVFLGSLGLLIVAGICYIPLLCYIRGNLKEYCCHKVDKRIESVIKKRQKKRLDENQKQAMKEARGDFSHLKNRKGEFTSKPLPQPTLPNLSVDDDLDDKSSMHTRVAPSTYTQDSYYYYNSDVKNANPPPMPAYNPYSTHQAPDAYATFNSSQATFQQDEYQPPYEDESAMHLTSGAAPFSHSQYPIDRPGSAAPNPYYEQQNMPPYSNSQYPIDRPGSAAPSTYHNNSQYPIDRPGSAAPSTYHNGGSQYPIDRPGSAAPSHYHNGSGNYDPHDVYQGRAVPSPRPQQRAPPSGLAQPVSGLAYDDADAYGGFTTSPNPQQQSHQQGMWNPGRDVERGGY
ncbi:hypothetical protein B0H17DRAFT_271873 [Mycena rosella]|uniref:Vacuole protein n=1 Tax=Mycena rosella TaxID=1033263 RepID=A0AAD7DVG6_MYCRO|nr:hypothetical protein B0H17DRAFT_271873 [Mycena rosella]